MERKRASSNKLVSDENSDTGTPKARQSTEEVTTKGISFLSGLHTSHLCVVCSYRSWWSGTRCFLQSIYSVVLQQCISCGVKGACRLCSFLPSSVMEHGAWL